MSADLKDFRGKTHTSTCLHHALRIQRRVAPREWPAAIAQVGEGCREEVEAYLRGIAQRMRAQRDVLEKGRKAL